MEKSNEFWVLGHKIAPVSISGDYDMILGETPPMVPGPPPHFHTAYNEVFLVIEGEMEFMVNGEVKTVRKGESVDLPPNVMHTFSNKSDVPCKWVNVHSPKGFLSFFHDMGISADEANAMRESVDDAIIQRVMQTAAEYDMHIQL